ncbi:asparagine synthetase B family protein [Luteibacter anthropi]|uniref:asparagine synthase (glutamine-hydrolyzing) n=1 Tax=Luteibacter anthropi TaxID=564369 RepID=A0A7X5ZIK7_9GAMM|nr:asparagine synthase-related protein [Luteibacter anthropi]NII06831.1 hypothetical protein [Luteibacter anthropi]
MSGLAGVWRAYRPMSEESLMSLSGHMLSAMPHRGHVRHVQAHAPLGVAIAACRPAHGPVSATTARSNDGRYIVVVAGDLTLSRDESPVMWAMQDLDSPADRLIRRIRSQGVGSAIAQIRGSACVAVIDSVEATLTLSRDKMGEKSLYIASTADGLLFATEVNAIEQLASPLAIDRSAVATLLRHGYIPSPHSIYKDVSRLPAGCFVQFQLDGAPPAHVTGLPFRRYWDVRKEVLGEIAERRSDGLRTAETDLRDVLAMSIEARHGRQSCALLTGDVESSVIAAMLQAQQEEPLQTFAVGFEGQTQNLERADRIASYLGCHFDPVVLGHNDVLSQVERVISTASEPPCLPSAVILGMAAGAAGHAHKQIVLGEGANELFFGHDAYRRATRQARFVGSLPMRFRQRLGSFKLARKAHAWSGHARDPFVKLTATSVEDHYHDATTLWQHPGLAVPGTEAYPTVFSRPDEWLDTEATADRLQYVDQRMRLGEGLLPSAEAACMAHGVTPCFPFMDESVWRFSWRLPVAYRYGYREHKLVLKRLAERYLPEKLLATHKPIAEAPVAAWLRGPLREWAGDLLNRRYLQQQGIFDPEEILPIWEAFLEGRQQWHGHLWPVLMFQAWQQSRRSCENRSSGLRGWAEQEPM